MKLHRMIAGMTIAAVLMSNTALSVFAANNAVVKSNTNLRAKAGIIFNVVKALNKDTPIEVVGKELYWYKVNVGGIQGYINDKSVTITDKALLQSYSLVKPNYEKISSYQTRFSAGSIGRNHNIELGAYKTSVLLKKGETFSFNKNTGNSTRTSAGWQEAGVIVDKQFTTGIGGGICQVSSTIYSAVKQVSNIKIVERWPHSIPVGYVPVSNEAMVNYNNRDLKFTNNNNFTIFVFTDVDQVTGTLTTTVYKVNPETVVKEPPKEEPKPEPINQVAKRAYVEKLKGFAQNPDTLLALLNITKEGVTDMDTNVGFVIDDVDQDQKNDLLIQVEVSLLKKSGDEIIQEPVIFELLYAYENGAVNLKKTFVSQSNQPESNVLKRYQDVQKVVKWYVEATNNNDGTLKIAPIAKGFVFGAPVNPTALQPVPVNTTALKMEEINAYQNSKTETPAPTPKVVVNSVKINYNVAPQNIDSRIYVEMRSLFESLGYEITYDEKTKATQIKNQDVIYVLEAGVDSKVMKKIVSGTTTEIPIEIPIKLVSNRTMFPLRFAGDLLGYEVGWDGPSVTASLQQPQIQPLIEEIPQETTSGEAIDTSAAPETTSDDGYHPPEMDVAE